MKNTQNPRIAVVALNPGIDRTMYFDAPIGRGEVNRATRTVTNQGCKGANAAILLARLGADVTYFTFTGGEFAKLYESFLEKEDLKTVAIPTKAGVRLNVKLSDGTSFTECNQAGGPISSREGAAMMLALQQSEFDCLYLAGSLPEGMPRNFYYVLTLLAQKKGAFVVLDADGDALKYALAAAPNLVKPNRAEFERLIPEGENISAKIALFREKYPQTVLLLSLGGEGAVLVGEKSALQANALPVRVRGTVAAGDTFLSAFTYATLCQDSADTALKKATAAAAAKVVLKGTALPSKEKMQERINEVVVSEFQDIQEK